MANIFTASSLKGSYVYFAIFVLAIVLASYLFLLRQPSIKEIYAGKGFEMTFTAFQETIRFANYKYIASQPVVNSQSEIVNGIWVENEKSLSYNGFGFPVGVDMPSEDTWQPLSSEQCSDVWYFLLGKAFYLAKAENSNKNVRPHSDQQVIEVVVSDGLMCEYRPNWVKNLRINYYPADGTVLFIDKTLIN